jgi:surface protein
MKRTLLLIVFIHFIFFLSATPVIHLKNEANSNAAAITDGFITQWETTSDNQQILIPIQVQYKGDYTYNVDWGDGQKSLSQTGNATHVYTKQGVYNVTITGNFPAIDFESGDGVNNGLIKSVVQWGNGTWQGMDGAFLSCYNLTSVPNNNGPIFAPNSTLYCMFYGCSSLNCDLDKWDLTNVRETSFMFYGCTVFNGNISGWNVSNVTNMQDMFYNALAFNADISSWDVTNVTLMDNMFNGATSFNGDISLWDVGQVTDFTAMFKEATSFNQPIGSWDMHSATHLNSMFNNDSAFNQPLGNWNISNVQEVKGLLSGTSLSAANYEATLNGWAAGAVIHGLSIGVDGLKYCDNSGHSILANDDGWDFVGDRQTCLVPAVPDNEGVVYVDSMIAVAGNGSSWTNALKYLSNAVESANTNMDITEIHVAKGSYYPTGDKNLIVQDSAFVISRSNLKVLGGYPNGGGDRALNANPTVLSGNLADPNNLNDNSFNMLYIANIPRTDSLIIDGFTISEVAAIGEFANSDADAGAAVSIIGCYDNTVLRNCRIVSNQSIVASAMSIAGFNEVTDQSSLDPEHLPNPQILNCLFEDNLIVTGLDGSYAQISGTIGIMAASPYFNHCDFVENNAYMGGSSMNMLFAQPLFNHCNFINNEADGFPISFNVSGGRPIYVNCLMKNNFIHGLSETALPVQASDINNAIIGNLQFGSSRLINCTVVNNKSAVSPTTSAPIILNSMESASYITNSIFWGNSGKTVLDQGNTQVSSALAYSLMEGLAANQSNHMLDGTGNSQIFVDSVNGNFKLLNSSPAIDAGLNDSLSLNLAAYLNGATNGGLDLAGNQRIINDVIDLGAFESTGGGLPVKSGDLTGKITSAGHAVLSWVTYTETNNKGFYIQRSSDGVQFTNQGFVATQALNGTGQSKLNYNYDAGVVSGTTYFRFVQVDQNGVQTVSNVVRLESKELQFKLLAFPNPVQNELHLKIQGELANNAQVILMNYAGKIFRQKQLSSKESFLDLQGLAAGVYILHYQDAKHSVIVKVVKQ